MRWIGIAPSCDLVNNVAGWGFRGKVSLENSTFIQDEGVVRLLG